MTQPSKRVLVLSDFHCGHEVGLTPPWWDPEPVEGSPFRKEWVYRRYMWDQFKQNLDLVMPVDVLIANGDLIDGRGERSGSVELLVLNRMKQADMACDIVALVGAPKLFVARGTDYHTGDVESWEDLVANKLNAERVGDILNVDVNGLMINARHHIGGSQTPIGRGTNLVRESTWNVLWGVRHDFPMADIIIRSHVHYFSYVGGPGWLTMTTPGLQGYGTRYGERRLSGIIDNGFVVFDVVGKGDFTWKALTFEFPHPLPSVA